MFIRLLKIILLSMIACAVVADDLTVKLPVKEKFHLFLLAGQSNMAGRGKIEAQDKVPHPRVLLLTKQGVWQPAVDPLHYDKSAAGAGLGRSFAIALAEKNPDVTIGLVPAACGGSSIVAWVPGGYHEQTQSHPYDDAVSRMKIAMAAGVLKGILWNQGGNDAISDERAAKHHQELTDMIQRFRAEFDNSALPFVIGQLGKFETNPWSAGRQQVDQAHRTVAKEIPHCAFVSADGLTCNSDGVHFNTESLREFGHRYAKAYLGLIGEDRSTGLGVLAGQDLVQLQVSTNGPVDLALTFKSPFDGSQQPYRLYLPSAYDGRKSLPLLLLMHGTGGDQNKYFDAKGYNNGIYKREAEQRGIVLLCPLGTDGNGLPTEWRGEAEINVLAAIEDVQRRFRIDPERIVCSGQSMGGTGTTYLCCRYPDLFAGGIPLASTYGHLSLVTNLRQAPMLFVQGEKDWPIYAATGPIPITEEMKRLGYNGELWMVADSQHNTMHVSTPRVIEWALEQKRVAHPRHITHRAYFPSHGRAWWVEISEIERPGWFAEVDAHAVENNHIDVAAKNAAQLVLRPDPELYDPSRPTVVRLDGGETFRGLCSIEEQLLLKRQESGWTATVEPRCIVPRTKGQDFVIGVVDDPPTWEGGPETTLGNWITDAMRDISGADIAICTKGHFRCGSKMRGAEIRAGQTLHVLELINWLRPMDAVLAEFTLKGSDLCKIIEMNLLDKPSDERFIVQVSGCRYRFDRSKPQGSRVIEADIVADQEYRIVCNSTDITRTDTLHLGGYFGKLNQLTLEPNLLSAVWHCSHKQGGRISANKIEGRVIEN